MVINNTGFSSIKIFCESKSAKIHIHNSRKIWSLQTPIILGASSNVRMLCSVESVSIPLAYNTVNETNQNFCFNDVFGKIDAGNYTSTTIVEAINRSQTNVKLMYIKETNKFLITGTSATLLYNTIDRCENNIYKLLGFVASTRFRNENGFHTPSGVCNLCYTSGIYISLNNCSNANIDTFHQAKSTCLLRIPIAQPVNTYLAHFNETGFKNLLSGSVLKRD